MFNNLRKFLRGGVSHNKQSLNSCFSKENRALSLSGASSEPIISAESKKNQPRYSVNCQAIPEYDCFSFGFAKVLTFALFLSLSAINIARADVCFLPDGQGCEQVPYEEYDSTAQTYPTDCYATKSEAMSARTDSMDSYYKTGDMWCIKSSCSGYNVTSMLPGGWNCQNCNDAKSKNYNKYKCSCNLEDVTPGIGYTIDLERCEEKPSACPSYASTDCVPDECHECNSINSANPVYSGGKECLIYSTVDEHCPDGYSTNEPAGGCYATQDMLCGEGKCYKAVDAPECGEGKRLVKANGVCSCECETGYHDDNGSCVKDGCNSDAQDELYSFGECEDIFGIGNCQASSTIGCYEPRMYWCIYPQEFTNTLFGGGINGGVHNITLEGDGVNKGGGKCSSADFYVPYGVSVSIKYTNDTVLPYSHRGWIFEPADFDDGYSPVAGYIKDSYFKENSFVATAAVLEQDERTMTPGDSIDLSPVISKAEDRDPFIPIPDRWILRCAGNYQLVHGKWQDTFKSNLITTAQWPLTAGMKNIVYVDTSSKRDWAQQWQEAVNYAKQTGYSGYAPGVLFEPEFCEEIFDCANPYGCTHSYLYGWDPNSSDRCTISDDSYCWGCYIGWHTQCVVFLESQSEPAVMDYVSCVDNKGNGVSKEEIMAIIGDSERLFDYVTCEELGSKVIGHSLPDE